jgi:hypothetical protein
MRISSTTNPDRFELAASLRITGLLCFAALALTSCKFNNKNGHIITATDAASDGRPDSAPIDAARDAFRPDVGCTPDTQRACACGNGTQSCGSNGQWGDCQAPDAGTFCVPGRTQGCAASPSISPSATNNCGTQACNDDCAWGECLPKAPSDCVDGSKRPCPLAPACMYQACRYDGHECHWHTDNENTVCVANPDGCTDAGVNDANLR